MKFEVAKYLCYGSFSEEETEALNNYCGGDWQEQTLPPSPQEFVEELDFFYNDHIIVVKEDIPNVFLHRAHKESSKKVKLLMTDLTII